MSATLDRHLEPTLKTAKFLDHLEVARQGFRVYLAGMTAGRLALAIGLAAAAVMLLDWWLILPTAARVLGLVLIAAAAVFAVVPPVTRFLRLSTGDAATAIERVFPDVGQRLTTSLDYVDPTEATVPARPALVAALVQDTDEHTRHLDLHHLVPWWRLAGLAAIVFVGFLTTLFSLGLSGDLRTAAQRLFLVPVHYSHVEVQPGNYERRAGESLSVQATVSGRPVRHLELRHRAAGQSAWQVIDLARERIPADAAELLPPQPVAGEVTTTLHDCQRDFEYQVVSGEIESPMYSVRVIHPLVLKEAVARVTPPAYTKRKPSKQPQGSLRVIEGSDVQLEFVIDRAPAKAVLEISRKSGKSTRRETQSVAVSGARLFIRWPKVAEDAEYRLVAEASEGGVRLESPAYRLRVQPDEKPTVKFVDPPESLEVTPSTEVPMLVTGGDDFGVAKMGVVVQVAESEKETLLLEDFADSRPTAESLARLFLEKHEVTFTDAVTYYAFVEDNRPGRPQRVTTDLRFIDIRPYKREFQMLKGGGSCCGNSVSLEELIARQRLNLNRSFSQLDRSEPDPEVLKRLVRNEQELHAATQEFADGLAARFGPVPSLEEAVAAMELAVSQLEAPELAGAVDSQEKALAGLVRSRQNLRKLLKEQSPAQCAECRKFDQQQNQKLRPPKKKEDDPVQLGDDVEKLAKKQKKFSEDLASRQSGAKTEKPESPKSEQKSSSQGESGSSESSKQGEQEDEPEMLKKRQDESAREAEELERRVREDASLTELARERMESGSKSVRESAESLEAGDEKAAQDAARKAAESLEQLAQQIAGLKTPDLSSRIGKARDLAQQLAEKQGDLSRRMQGGESKEGGPSESPGDDGDLQTPGAEARPEDQRRLAEAARTLADLLSRLQSDAVDQDRELGQSLTQAVDRHPPEDSAQRMGQAAERLEQGDRPGAAGEAAEAATDLAALAKDLDEAHRGLVRQTLDQLLAAEKQAAKTQDRMTAARTASDKTGAETQLAELKQALERLSQPGKAVSEATRELAQASGQWSDDRDPGGNYIAPSEALNGLKRTIQALQARIQELILKDAILDRDGAVPPEYQKLVEEYYKALSEDLR